MRRLAIFMAALVLCGGIIGSSLTALGAEGSVPADAADRAGADGGADAGTDGGSATMEPGGQSVSGGDAEPMSASGGDAEPVPLEDDTIYNVAFPANTKAYFDPGNLSGNGQVFSEEFKVENYGNTDIAIQISGIEVLYARRDDSYVILEDDVTDHQSETKDVHLEMIWKDAEGTQTVLDIAEGAAGEYVLFLDAAEYGADGAFIGLREGSTGSFSFTGTLNSNPQIAWESGEMTLRFSYEIVNQSGTPFSMREDGGEGILEPSASPEPSETPEGTLEPSSTPEVALEPSETPESVPEPSGTPEGTLEPGGTPEGTLEPGGAPESVPEPSGTPEGTLEPGGTPEGTLEPGGTPEGTLEPGGTPEGTLEPGATPEGTLEPGGTPESGTEPPAVPEGTPGQAEEEGSVAGDADG